MGEFCMPSLGADMETGRLVEWLVAPGTPVKRGDIVALVETQKGLFEVEIFEDGIMGEPLVQAGEEVAVGTVLALIQSEGAPVVDTAAPSATASTVEQPTPQQAQPEVPVAPPQPKDETERRAASPSALGRR